MEHVLVVHQHGKHRGDEAAMNAMLSDADIFEFDACIAMRPSLLQAKAGGPLR